MSIKEKLAMLDEMWSILDSFASSLDRLDYYQDCKDLEEEIERDMIEDCSDTYPRDKQY